MQKAKKRNKKFSSVLIMVIFLIMTIIFCATCIFFGGNKKVSAKENKWGWKSPVAMNNIVERVTIDVSRQSGTVIIPLVSVGPYGTYTRTSKATFIIYTLPVFTSWGEYSSSFSDMFFGKIYYPNECIFLSPEKKGEERERILVYHNCYDSQGNSEIFFTNRSCP
ncbi:MAG: hypothetical protein PHO23_00705 [Candidatus Pacebacteria bacterium]|nr:hypothetical protein [Candidatus Paceibacterota bacterium]